MLLYVGKGLMVLNLINAYPAAFKQLNPVPPMIRMLTHLQQTTFENIVAKEEIAQNDYFATMSSTVFINYTFIYIYFSLFCS